MKNYFLNPFSQLEIPSTPLLFYKWGISLCVAIQAAGYWLDANLIFSSQGLFPGHLVDLYYPSGVFGFESATGRLICLLLLAFSSLAIFARLQTFSFLVIAGLEMILLKRNFPFVNAGDSALIYLSLMAALTPSLSWKTRNSAIPIQSLLPLMALVSIVYLINLGAKLSSRWLTGNGLHDSLRHLELVRQPMAVEIHPGLIVLNYLAVLLILVAVFVPWISFGKSKLKNFLVITVIIYHLSANFVFRLSWLSLPYIALELSLLVFKSKGPRQVALRTSSWKPKVAWALVLLGFAGMKGPGEPSSFSENSGFPLGHNWYMFAPPPPASYQWQIQLTTNENKESVPLEVAFNKDSFSVFQHQYKFINNLRRSESVPIAEHFSKWLCRNLEANGLKAVKLNYSVLVFQTEETFKVDYPEVSCLE